MKKYCVILFILFAQITFAQDSLNTIPPYLKTLSIPNFKIIQPNGKSYTQDSLPVNKPVIFMYFSPDCGHCQYQTKSMIDSIQFLQQATIVLVAYKKLEDIKEFANQYELNKFNHIVIGRDPKYFIPSFFRVKFTPFIAIYNMQHEFVKAFDKGASVIDIHNYL